jgi:2-oxoglutarate ferredoxin oxidoreductase subunit alpha
MRIFTNGAEMIARGALRAGCNFFAGYPITPASPILQAMIDELPKAGGVAIQAEDEIAALGMCIGAAMAGSRAMTATSGPGISLFSENIGAAIMLETPLVIVDVQRMGPATGGATTTAQGDVQFLRWGTSGGFPTIVLCPTDAAECYWLIQVAFDLAERFRTPVFLATDKHTALDKVALDVESLAETPVRKRALASIKGEFTPYRFDPPEHVSPMAHYGGPHLVRVTTSAHDEAGYLIKDPAKMGSLNRHLSAKIEAHADEIALVKSDLQAGAETLVVSYGVTAGAMDEAVLTARQKGARVSALTVYSLWPIPERQIREAAQGVRRVVVAELNLGQYRREVERLTRGEQDVIGVNRVDGELITPDEILTSLIKGGRGDSIF